MAKIQAVNKIQIMENDFQQISIRGRYTYCYLCLQNVIVGQQLQKAPEFLDIILKKFTNVPMLDDWHTEAADVMPSTVMDERSSIDEFKTITVQQLDILKEYYSSNKLVAEIIEEMTWLGISNIYVAFNGTKSLECVKAVIDLLIKNHVNLPDFSEISSFSINERKGWGNLIDIDKLLD